LTTPIPLWRDGARSGQITHEVMNRSESMANEC
jgi:hypothetical protein